MSLANDITADRFDNEVINSDIPVMVDFWAEWCAPCKALIPTIDQLAEEYNGKIKIFKVNVQNEPSIASKFGVTSIPTLIIFKNGEIVDRMVGSQSKANLVTKIDKAL
ncbi:MAG: thioredoxin [Armatimonadota bacterium]